MQSVSQPAPWQLVHETPAERQKLLRRLFDLETYERMGRVARARARAARERASWTAEQLAADSPATRLLGDGLVPLDSALGRHANAGRCLSFDKTNSWVGYGMSHLDLLGHPAVYARLRDWLA